MCVTRDNAINLGLAILGGLMMRWSFGLHPLWWLAWWRRRHCCWLPCEVRRAQPSAGLCWPA
jgi:hypothetical protein